MRTGSRRSRWSVAAALLAQTASLLLIVAVEAPSVGAVTSTCQAPALGEGGSGVAGSFVGITPTRVLDTRTGVGGPARIVGADCVVQVALGGAIPASASGVAATVTVADAAATGFVTAYPCGSPRPNVSNVNTRTDSPVPNLVVAPVDATRLLCVYSSVDAHVIVDVTGYFAADGAQFHDVAPARVLDSRIAADGTLADPLPAGIVVQLNLTSNQIPTSAVAAALNLTVTGAQAPGFATAYPCGAQVPNASNVNYLANEDRAAQTMVGLSGGVVCIFVSTRAHLVVDVWGWFGGADGADIVTTAATRLVDSRLGIGGWSTRIAPGETRSFSVPQLAGGVRTAMLDVVATNALGSGYLTLFPCGSPQPATSSVNYTTAGPAMNLVTVALGADSRVCVFSLSATDVVIDLLGFADNPGPLRSLTVSPRPLTTTFTPAGRDYAIACSAGTNRVSVSAQALPGYSITIGSAIAPTQLVTSVDVMPNALLQIDISQNAVVVDQYFVRCLPPDFPALTSHRLGKVAPGWYLVTPATFLPGAHYAVILDERGVPLWYQKAPTEAATASSAIVDFKRLPSGALAWVPVLGVGFGVNPTGAYQVRNLAGVVTKTVTAVGTPTDQHDMIALSNGNFAVFTYEETSGVDLTSLGDAFGTSERVARSNIQEISGVDGSLVWQWKSADHIDVGESVHPLRGLDPNDATVVDLEHFNSIDVAPNGDYIVSARHLDAVFRIDRATGKIVWKLGGAPNVKDAARSLSIVGDPLGGPKGMHDARLQTDGSVTMFDNQLGTTNATRAVRYALNGSGGATATTATMVRGYARPDNATIGTMGSTRVTAEGDLVIGWGAGAPLVSEIDANDRLVLQIDGPAGGSYRAVREPVAAFSRTLLRSSSPG